MSLYTIDLSVCGTAYIYASTLDNARRVLEEIYSIDFDVNDGRWFTAASEISLATAMTVYGPLPGQLLKPVTEAAMSAAMRSSRRGRRSNASPPAHVHFNYSELKLHSADLQLGVTAFIRAGTLDEAQAWAGKLHGQGIHLELFRDWFTPAGLNDPDLPIVVSPRIAILGLLEGSDLSLHWSEEGAEWNVAQGGATPAVVRIDGQGEATSSDQADVDLEIAVKRLKGHCEQWGGKFALMTDEDARAIVAFASTRLDR